MKPSPSAERGSSLPSACSTRDLVRRLDQTRAIGDASGGEGCHITVGRLIRTDTPVHRQRDWASDCPPHHALPTPGIGRQNVDRALELALFSSVNHHLPWASVSAISSRAAFLRCWDLADGQLWTRTSS